MKKSFVFIILFLHICTSDCVNDADRDNPLDSRSHQKCGIKGIVYTFYQPYEPLSGADVFISPGNHWTKSNQNGEFAIFNLDAGDYIVAAHIDGYATDSIHVNLSHTSAKEIQFHLNGLPSIIDVNICSGHISRWLYQEDMYVLKVDAEVIDGDGLGDISDVVFCIPQFNFYDTLRTSDEPSEFNGLYYAEELPAESLPPLLGHPCFIRVHDRPGSQIESAPVYLARIIETRPTYISPQGYEPATSLPELIWQPLQLLYPFHFKVDVIRYDQSLGIHTNVWSLDNIPADSSRVQVTKELSLGAHYWTISIVDEFGNWSRSREASFEVK